MDIWSEETANIKVSSQRPGSTAGERAERPAWLKLGERHGDKGDTLHKAL